MGTQSRLLSLLSLFETEHKYLNHTFYYPNAVTWNAIDITMVDPGGDPDAAATLAGIVSAAAIPRLLKPLMMTYSCLKRKLLVLAKLSFAN